MNNEYKDAINIFKRGLEIKTQIPHLVPAYETAIEALNKFAPYEDAEKQGLLLILPCKVGDYVYQLNESRGKIELKKVSQIIIESNKNDFLIHIIFGITGKCTNRDFGKTVFHDKSEALHKLDKYMSRNKP